MHWAAAAAQMNLKDYEWPHLRDAMHTIRSGARVRTLTMREKLDQELLEEALRSFAFADHAPGAERKTIQFLWEISVLIKVSFF